jgi:signal transduction histidine kinase
MALYPEFECYPAWIAPVGGTQGYRTGLLRRVQTARIEQVLVPIEQEADQQRDAVFHAWRIAEDLCATRDATTLVGRLASHAREIGAADACLVLLYERDAGDFLPAGAGTSGDLDERWLQRQGYESVQAVAKRAAESADLLEIDVASRPDLDPPLLSGKRRPHTMRVLALFGDDLLVAALVLLYADAPATSDTETLRAIAKLAGQGLANALVHQQDKAMRSRMLALDDASKALASELSLDQVLQRVVAAAASIAGAQYGALGVVGPDGYLSDFITTGIGAEDREKIGSLPRGHGLLGVLIRSGRSLRVPNIGKDPRRVGFPPNHPPMTSLMGVPIRIHGTIVGDLYLSDKIGGPEFSEEDQRQIELLAAHAGIAIENARLYTQLGELTLLHERERIARDLHDGIIQDIYAATLQLEDISEDAANEEARLRLVGVADRLSGIITDIRTYIQGLRAKSLDGRMLSDGIAALTRAIDGRGGLRARYYLEGQPYPFPDDQANTVMLIAREALSNVVKYADASTVKVRLAYEAAGLTLVVQDDGRGFNPRAPRGDEHRGIRNMRTRTDEVGGTLSLQTKPGSGTSVTAFVPFEA